MHAEIRGKKVYAVKRQDENPCTWKQSEMLILDRIGDEDRACIELHSCVKCMAGMACE